MAIPLSCFVKPDSLPFPKAEVAQLAKTSVEKIVEIHHWRFAAWVERKGCIPITVSFRRLSTWIPKLQQVVDSCKGWRRLRALRESLEADFVKHPEIYPTEVREDLRARLDARAKQVQANQPRLLHAENLTAALELVLRSTRAIPFLEPVGAVVQQHEALLQRFPHLLERLREAWRQQFAYLREFGAA